MSATTGIDWRELDPEALSDVRGIVQRLLDLGVPTDSLQDVRDWLSVRQEAANELHHRHLRMCKITTLAGHGFGWGNCPDFICPHCGSPPDEDGDHSCPCPYRDEECPDHRGANR